MSNKAKPPRAGPIELDGADAPVQLPSSFRNDQQWACVACKLILTKADFLKRGCPNRCFHAKMDEQDLEERISWRIRGSLCIMNPQKSWAARYNQLAYVKGRAVKPGCYALEIQPDPEEQAQRVRQQQQEQQEQREQRASQRASQRGGRPAAPAAPAGPGESEIEDGFFAPTESEVEGLGMRRAPVPSNSEVEMFTVMQGKAISASEVEGEAAPPPRRRPAVPGFRSGSDADVARARPGALSGSDADVARARPGAVSGSDSDADAARRGRRVNSDVDYFATGDNFSVSASETERRKRRKMDAGGSDTEFYGRLQGQAISESENEAASGISKSDAEWAKGLRGRAISASEDEARKSQAELPAKDLSDVDLFREIGRQQISASEGEGSAPGLSAAQLASFGRAPPRAPPKDAPATGQSEKQWARLEKPGGKQKDGETI